ncbi:MAG: guanylate kinase [Candidatus Saccharibacteria bacterium]|nr:guanylate kinase [Candidatus Saccharibacteria bacterium]
MGTVNELRHLHEFHKYLDGYRLSEIATARIADLKLVLLVAPSSSGRNTIIRELEKTGEFHFIVSDTTRQPRVNDGVLEEHGREYWFRTEEEVLDEVKNGEFLEAAVIHNQQVSGISTRELDKAKRDNKIAITDIEIIGAANIYRAKPDTDVIFIVPPDFDTWINRLHQRGELPEDEVRRRLESALEEFESALQEPYYKFVINHHLEDSVAEVYEIAKFDKVDAEAQERGRAIVEKLLINTREYLSKKH